MSFKITSLCLVTCAVQVLTADPKLHDHTGCIKDTDTAIQSYDKLLKEFHTLQDQLWKSKKETVERLQRSSQTSVCTNFVELLKEVTKSQNEGVCEILIAGDLFEGPWKSNQNVPKQEVCEFIAANQPTLGAIVEHNQHVSSNCSKVTTGVSIKDNCAGNDGSKLKRVLPHRTVIIIIIIIEVRVIS